MSSFEDSVANCEVTRSLQQQEEQLELLQQQLQEQETLQQQQHEQHLAEQQEMQLSLFGNDETSRDSIPGDVSSSSWSSNKLNTDSKDNNSDDGFQSNSSNSQVSLIKWTYFYLVYIIKL